MGLKPDLDNPSNWGYLGETDKTATPFIGGDGETKYFPIPAFDFPLIATSPTLGIIIASTTAELSWKYAGVCGMLIRTGILVGGNYDSHTSDWIKLWLGKINVVRFPELVSDYTIRFYPPKWFKDYSVTIQEYIGTGKADIEGKIDAVYDAII